MKPLLVTYATMAGSTREVAQMVAAALRAQGVEVAVQALDEVSGLEAYEGVVVGAPMILGWHRAALRFLRRHRAALQQKPLALFITALSLTNSADVARAVKAKSPVQVGGVPVTVDEGLLKGAVREEGLSLRERYARLTNYMRPILRACGAARPASVGFFGGRMEYGRLKWWAVLFAMFIVRAPAGDRRNAQAVEGWARALPEVMGLAAGPGHK